MQARTEPSAEAHLTLTIDPAAEPKTMRELREKLIEIRAAANLIGAQNYLAKDLEMRTNPLFERASELEVLAADVEIQTLDDLLAAFDVFDGMKSGIDTDYSDRRDANLIEAMRRAVVHFMGVVENFGSIPVSRPRSKPE